MSQEVSIRQLVAKIPLGYVEGIYQGRRYGISKSEFNEGKSSKIFAEELGGNDFISLNYYQTTTQDLLKPCEMPEEKVLRFLQGVVIEADLDVL